MTNTCIACGRHMLNASQHALGDSEKPYCINCSNPDGSMRTYEEILVKLTDYYAHTAPVDHATAVKLAKERLAMLPFWSTEVTMH